MALVAFQRAFYELVADSLLCMEARENPEILRGRYDLTEKEFTRLRSIVGQKGMATNCNLYRMNRVTPLYTLLPYTCKLLGDDFVPLLNRFWGEYNQTGLQFGNEVELFCHFLKLNLLAGNIQNPYLLEILGFEYQLNELRYRQESGHDAPQTRTYGKYALNPGCRVVPFTHDPPELFRHLVNDNTPMPPNLPTGHYSLLLELNGAEVDMKVISPELGHILNNLQLYAELPKELLDSGLVFSV